MDKIYGALKFTAMVWIGLLLACLLYTLMTWVVHEVRFEAFEISRLVRRAVMTSILGSLIYLKSGAIWFFVLSMAIGIFRFRYSNAATLALGVVWICLFVLVNIVIPVEFSAFRDFMIGIVAAVGSCLLVAGLTGLITWVHRNS